MASVIDPFNQPDDSIYNTDITTSASGSTTLGLGEIPDSSSFTPAGTGLQDLGLSNNQYSYDPNLPGLDQYQLQQGRALGAYADKAEYDLGQEKAFDDSWMGKSQPYLKAASLGMNTLKSGFDIWAGFQQLDIARQARDDAREQWTEQKAELTRIKGVRKKINASYVS